MFLFCILLLLSLNPWVPFFGIDNYAEFRWMQIGLLLAMCWHWLYRWISPPAASSHNALNTRPDIQPPTAYFQHLYCVSKCSASLYSASHGTLAHNAQLLIRSLGIVALGISLTLIAYYLNFSAVVAGHISAPAVFNPMLWALQWVFLGGLSLYCARFFAPSTLSHAFKPLLLTLLFCTLVLFSYMLVNVALSIAFAGHIDLFVVLVEFENIRMLNQFQIITLPLLVFGYQWANHRLRRSATAMDSNSTAHRANTADHNAMFSALGIFSTHGMLSTQGTGISALPQQLRQQLQRQLSALGSHLQPWLKPTVVFCLIASYFFIFLTAGRAAMLALLMFAGLLWHYQRQAFKPQFIFALVAFLMYQLITLVLNYEYPLLRTDSSMRLEMWGELLAHYPWQQLLWGYGGGNYPYLTKLVANAHPHNWLLQWLTDWGFIALLGFVGFCGVVWRCWLWSYHKEQQAREKCSIHHEVTAPVPDADAIKQMVQTSFDLRSYIAMAWLMLLLYGFFDGVMVMPLPQLFFALYSGILLQPLWQRATEFNTAPCQVAKAVSIDGTAQHSLGKHVAGKHVARKHIAGFRLWLRYLVLLLVVALSLLYLYVAIQSFFTTQALPSPFYGPNFWFIGDPV
jgi:hypothetical protein